MTISERDFSKHQKNIGHYTPPNVLLTKHVNKLKTDAKQVSGDVIPCGTTTHAGDSLGSPASESETDASFVITDAHSHDSDAPSESTGEEDTQPGEIDYSAYDIPGADDSDDVEPETVESSAEDVEQAKAFFAQAKQDETDGQKLRVRTQSHVWSVMQYHKHPTTGQVMYTQQQLDAALTALNDEHKLFKFAYIWHLRDRLVQVDEGTGEPECCALKPAHVHIVLWLHKEHRMTLRQVSDIFEIPSARVKAPKEVAQENGDTANAGRGAAEKSFYDFCEYLTHETRKSKSIAGVKQPERRYLVDEHQETHPGKYQYGRGRVVANFPFSEDMNLHMASRFSAASGAHTKTARRDKLRMLAMEGALLEDLYKIDPQAYGDDLPRLDKLIADYQKRNGSAKAAEIGKGRSKAFVYATGKSRHGKDVFLSRLGEEFMNLGALAGQKWTSVAPPNAHAGEGVAGFDIAHHEDIRYDFMPRYSQALVYLDPKRSTPIAARNYARPAPTQRLTMASSTEAPEAMGVTMRARKDSADLAQHEEDMRRMSGFRRSLPKDVDEFLFRIGWFVEVFSPVPAQDDMTDEEFAEFKDNMVMKIYRYRDSLGGPVIQDVHAPTGYRIGSIATRSEKVPVGTFRGCDVGALFLALLIFTERNKDVSKGLSPEAMQPFTERYALAMAENDRRAEEERLRIEEAERIQIAAAEQRNAERIAENDRKNAERVAEAERIAAERAAIAAQYAADPFAQFFAQQNGSAPAAQQASWQV